MTYVQLNYGIGVQPTDFERPRINQACLVLKTADVNGLGLPANAHYSNSPN